MNDSASLAARRSHRSSPALDERRSIAASVAASKGDRLRPFKPPSRGRRLASPLQCHRVAGNPARSSAILWPLSMSARARQALPPRPALAERAQFANACRGMPRSRSPSRARSRCLKAASAPRPARNAAAHAAVSSHRSVDQCPGPARIEDVRDSRAAVDFDELAPTSRSKPHSLIGLDERPASRLDGCAAKHDSSSSPST